MPASAAKADDGMSRSSPTLRWRAAPLAAAVVMRLCLLALLVSAAVAAQLDLLTRGLPGHDAPPAAGALYAQRIELTAAGSAFHGYVVPAIDERRVLRYGDRAAVTRSPAVLLVPHSYGNAHALDRLIAPLHEAGVVVMTLSPHHGGATRRTFGGRERKVIAAAVAALGGRPDVDPSRVSVVATGDAAVAALLAARDGAPVARLVLHAPPADFDAALDELAVHPRLRPLCRWAVRLMLHVDVDELDAAELCRTAGPKAILLGVPPADAAGRGSVVRTVATATLQGK